jgi:hypothetical protein
VAVTTFTVAKAVGAFHCSATGIGTVRICGLKFVQGMIETVLHEGGYFNIRSGWTVLYYVSSSFIFSGL